MKNKFEELVKERLKDRLEWKNYFEMLLTHHEISFKSKKEFYKERPLLNLILKIYFFPYNLLKYYNYLKDRHYYERMDKEIKILKQELKDG